MNVPQRESTEPERNVLKLIARSYPNSEIAEKLGISIEEVGRLKHSSMQLLGLRSRVEVVRYVSAQGWTEEESNDVE